MTYKKEQKILLEETYNKGWRKPTRMVVKWFQAYSHVVWQSRGHEFESWLVLPASGIILAPWWCYSDGASVCAGCSLGLICSLMNTRARTWDSGRCIGHLH